MDEGDVLVDQAPFSKSPEMISVYRNSRDCYVESLGILNSLKETGKLTSVEKSHLVTLTNSLAGVEERLQDATLSTKAKQP